MELGLSLAILECKSCGPTFLSKQFLCSKNVGRTKMLVQKFFDSNSNLNFFVVKQLFFGSKNFKIKTHLESNLEGKIWVKKSIGPLPRWF